MTEDEEFERLYESLERYEHADDETVEDTEYELLFQRWEILRRAGHGPQPHHLDG